MENQNNNSHVSFGKYISVIQRNNMYYINKSLQQYNLKNNEYKYLTEIFISSGLCQEDLVDILRQDKYEVAKTIKSLEYKGYIYKEKDKLDKRKWNIYPTDKALLIKEDIIAILKKSSDILTLNFTDEEKTILENLFIKMENNIFSEVQSIKAK